jgi:Tol biopolymer transport system component
VDDVEGNPYKSIFHLVFSPDSKHVAWNALRQGKWLVVVDGVEGRAYEVVFDGPVFSPDSKHVAFTAERGGKQLLVADGAEGNEYDRFVGNGPVYDSPTQFHALALRGGELFRVETEIVMSPAGR